MSDAEKSEHADEAESLLGRVANVDDDGEFQIHYLLVGAVVHALLDVAAALRERR